MHGYLRVHLSNVTCNTYKDTYTNNKGKQLILYMQVDHYESVFVKHYKNVIINIST